SIGRGEGPDTHTPDLANTESWHGQAKAPRPSSQSTEQPACGHTVDSARTPPSSWRTSQQAPRATSVKAVQALRRSGATTVTRTGLPTRSAATAPTSTGSSPPKTVRRRVGELRNAAAGTA